MSLFDDERLAPPTRKPPHEIGQDLSRISVAELAERVEALRAEIGRLEAEIAVKTCQRSAADQLFRS